MNLSSVQGHACQRGVVAYPDQLLAMTVQIYSKYFSDDDIQQVIKMYETPNWSEDVKCASEGRC